MKNLILPLIACFVLFGCSREVDTTRPNVVLIFIDDLGYGDVGKHGAIGYETPAIDNLANQGMMFTHFYSAQAVCSASRAGLLTGCYPNRIGISGAYNHGARVGLNPDETTIAEMLREVGYKTAIFGKWHLGHREKFLPLQHGFHEYVGLPYSNDMWPVDYDGKPHEGRKSNYPKLPFIEGNETVRYIENLQDQDALTTIYTEHAVDFINRNKDNPFFLYLPHTMVHVPLGVSDKFRGKSEQGFYGDVMMELDWSVNEVVSALEKNGLTENTLVIFTSDNGPWLNYGNHAGNTAGLREGKGTSWEGGQREPAFMKWPAVIKEGGLSPNIASAIDILPTLAEITGASLPDHKIDGVSILPLLEGDKEANPRDHFFYYYHKNNLEAVRKDNWKLVLPHSYRSYEGVLPGNDAFPGKYNSKTTGLELYNLRRDPGEEYDVIDQYPEVVEEIMVLVEQARADLGDNLTDREGANVRPIGWLGPPPEARNLGDPHLGMGGTVSYSNEFNTRYTGGGEQALIDGKLGNAEEYQRSWQAWHQDNMEVVVDLGEVKDITSVTVSFLKNHGAWIFLPEKVRFEVSENGNNYSQIGSTEHPADADERGPFVQEDGVKWEGKGRFVKIVAENVGLCPDWHMGAGEKAWVFADEIVIR